MREQVMIAYALIQTLDGGFALVGETYSYHNGSSDIWLVKTNENGIVEWNQTYRGTGREGVSSLIHIADNEFVLAGRTNSWGAGSDDMWLVKISVLSQNPSTNVFFGLLLLVVIVSLLAIMLLYQKLN